jgi:hypothetical protein
MDQTCTMNSFFFGYGSLVNTATHNYQGHSPATASGWQRAWCSTPGSRTAFLTAVEAPGVSIEGLMAAVPGGDWQALDTREAGYNRLDARGSLGLTDDDTRELAIYAIAPDNFIAPSRESPILLSYLDVVLQGYLQVYGQRGAEAFIETTIGWDAPVLNDRSTPFYPRHQKLTETERGFVDSILATLGADVFTAMERH